jgi:hypothetical protein
VLNANPAGTYWWKKNGNYIPGGTNPTYTATSAGSYTVDIISVCSASSAPTIITVNPLPTATITQAGNVLTAPAGFAAYQWYKNSTPIAGATSNSYTATQSGSYYVVVTNSNNCSGQSNTIGLTVGIDDVSAGTAIEVYPNPNKGSFTVALPDSRVPTHVSIISSLGHKVQAEVSRTGQTLQINCAGLASGIYSIELVYANEVIRSKFCKQ